MLSDRVHGGENERCQAGTLSETVWLHNVDRIVDRAVPRVNLSICAAGFQRRFQPGFQPRLQVDSHVVASYG